jgi:hypothetical protein
MPRSPRLLAIAAALCCAPAVLAQYCAAGADTCVPINADEYISRVVFNTIHNLSSGPTGCYSDYTSISTSVEPGSAYAITVDNPNGYPGDQCVAWIDFNQDSTFGDNASGEQFNLSADATGAEYTGVIPIPATATLGATRLRIRLQYTGSVSPCGNALYGEVEDYTVTIVAPTVGACCDSTGACTMTTPGACPGGAGSFQGVGNGCLPSNPCGGACCDTSGACTVTLAAACPSGSFFIDHRACTADTCRYCDAGSGACSVSDADERISGVVFVGIDNPSGSGDGPAGCYNDFTFFTTDILPGQSYPITVSNAGAYTQDAATVWIDWNHDFILGAAPSDEEFPLMSDGTGATFTGTITVPVNALPGPTRMRIRLAFDTTPLPCGTAAYGEIEDYTVNVAGTGTCCVDQSCTFTTLDACAGGIYHDGGSCSPNPCLAPGVCCRGCTCNTLVTSSALCAASITGTNAGAFFASSAFACNAPASASTPCCLTDYDKQNGTGVADIFDFLNDWFAGSRFAVFHGDGLNGSPAIQDIFDYLNAWFAAGC